MAKDDTNAVSNEGKSFRLQSFFYLLYFYFNCVKNGVTTRGVKAAVLELYDVLVDAFFLGETGEEYMSLLLVKSPSVLVDLHFHNRKWFQTKFSKQISTNFPNMIECKPFLKLHRHHNTDKNKITAEISLSFLDLAQVVVIGNLAGRESIANVVYIKFRSHKQSLRSSFE